MVKPDDFRRRTRRLIVRRIRFVAMCDIQDLGVKTGIVWHIKFIFNGFINNIKDGSKVRTDIIANNIAIPVKIPKYIVGINLDKTKIENPKTIVIEVFKIALPTVE